MINAFETAPRYFFGGVQEIDGVAQTTGGRCVTVVGIGYNIMNANKNAYKGVTHVNFEGLGIVRISEISSSKLGGTPRV